MTFLQFPPDLPTAERRRLIRTRVVWMIVVPALIWAAIGAVIYLAW